MLKTLDAAYRFSTFATDRCCLDYLPWDSSCRVRVFEPDGDEEHSLNYTVVVITQGSEIDGGSITNFIELIATEILHLQLGRRKRTPLRQRNEFIWIQHYEQKSAPFREAERFSRVEMALQPDRHLAFPEWAKITRQFLEESLLRHSLD